MTLAAATTPRIVVLGSANDAFGAQLRATLEAEGIDTRALRTTAAPTGIAQITVTDDGENSITVVAGANGLADLRDDERTLIAEASHLVVQLERPEPLLIEALRHARAHGVTTVLTPAPARAPLTELIGLADVLVPNAKGKLEPARVPRFHDAYQAGGGSVESVGGTDGSVGVGAGGVMLSVGGVVSTGSGGLGGGVSSGSGPQAVIRPALSSARPRPIVSR